jgi:hypothetical protein
VHALVFCRIRSDHGELNDGQRRQSPALQRRDEERVAVLEGMLQDQLLQVALEAEDRAHRAGSRAGDWWFSIDARALAVQARMIHGRSSRGAAHSVVAASRALSLLIEEPVLRVPERLRLRSGALPPAARARPSCAAHSGTARHAPARRPHPSSIRSTVLLEKIVNSELPTCRFRVLTKYRSFIPPPGAHPPSTSARLFRVLGL